MPPGFGLVDTALVSIPFCFAVLGLIRGAPVEFTSCVGCMMGVAAAWLVSLCAPIQEMGAPVGPLIALATGVIVWRLTRRMSAWLGLDTRWVDWGRLFDSAAGFSMGGMRGTALVCAGCLTYAMLVPFGLPDASRMVAYPFFLSMGSRVTNAVVAAAPPALGRPFADAPIQTAAFVPLPSVQPQSAPAIPPQSPALTTIMHALAPPAIAATVQPLAPVQTTASYHPDIPVRQVPVSLIETHHNIRHPFGLWTRAAHR